MLLPLWLFPQMRDEEQGWFSILLDEEVGLSRETDLDVRGGCLAVYFKHDPVAVIEVEPERETLDQMFDDGLVMDAEAEAFVNGMPGSDDEPVVHPFRDDEHQ